MTNVLAYSEAWGQGGIEAFVMNVVRAVQGQDLSFDICSTWDWSDSYDKELEEARVHRFSLFKGEKPGQVTRLVKGVSFFTDRLKARHYDAVWINTMNGMGFSYAKAAERLGVPVRVVHAHSADVGVGASGVKRLVSSLGSSLYGGCSTRNLACSQAAGRFLFGERPFEVVNNGIDTERFAFCEASRKTVRDELGIGDAVLLGNIGRMRPEKNPLFQIEVFAEYKIINGNSKYLMVGKPDMADEILALASRRGVDGDVIIHDPVENVAPFYSALDAMLMPSIVEGLGIVQVEAQCASLPVLSTDSLPEEARVTQLAQVCSLEQGPRVWAERLDRLVGEYEGGRSRSYAEIVADKGYSFRAAGETMSAILRDSLLK